jgi:hypothetical protein
MREPGAASVTPASRIGELLERWPHLESVLTELSPHLKALRNPVLRRTVAKVATEAGEHPMPHVMADLAQLEDAQVYQVITPFVPAPLLDMARGKGFLCHSVAEAPGLVRTFFRREGRAADGRRSWQEGRADGRPPQATPIRAPGSPWVRPRGSGYSSSGISPGGSVGGSWAAWLGSSCGAPGERGGPSARSGPAPGPSA